MKRKSILVMLILLLALSLTGCKSSDYKTACGYMESAKYDAAMQLFETIIDYKDSGDKIYECKYLKAETYLENDKFDEAKELFTEIIEYSDAADRVKGCDYAYAESLIENEELQAAYDMFVSLGDYSDAKDRAAEVEEMMAIHATSITLSKTTASLDKTKTLLLTATLLPEDTTDTIQSWESSDTSIVSVDQEGNIVANEYGTATVSAITTNDLKAECVVTVQKAAVVSSTADSTKSSGGTTKSYTVEDVYPLAQLAYIDLWHNYDSGALTCNMDYCWVEVSGDFCKIQIVYSGSTGNQYCYVAQAMLDYSYYNGAQIGQLKNVKGTSTKLLVTNPTYKLSTSRVKNSDELNYVESQAFMKLFNKVY